MKIVKQLLVFLGFAAGVAALVLQFYEPPFFKRVTENKYATVRINNVTRGTYGSGAVISQSGTILTVAHLALPGDRITVTTHYRNLTVNHLALVGVIDKESQLMLLFTRDTLPPPVEIGRSADIRDGEMLYTIGFPGTMTRPTISSGTVAQRFFMYPGYLPRRSIMIDAYPTLGMSGSPIFNRDGEVVAIFNAFYNMRAPGVLRTWSLVNSIDPLPEVIKRLLAATTQTATPASH